MGREPDRNAYRFDCVAGGRSARMASAQDLAFFDSIAVFRTTQADPH